MTTVQDTQDAHVDPFPTPGPVRRTLSLVLFHLPETATAVSVGGTVGLLFWLTGMPPALSLLCAAVTAAIVLRVATAAWYRVAGLRPITNQNHVDQDDELLIDTDEADDVGEVAADTDPACSAEPAAAAAR